MYQHLPPPSDPPEPDWRPGDPIYAPDDLSFVSYTGVLSDPCGPGCWHHHPTSHGGGMRWSPDWPALRFLPDGLSVDGLHPDRLPECA